MGGLMMMLFWGGLIAVSVWFLRNLLGPGAYHRSERVQTEGRSRTSDRALDILKERYARGEISKAEFAEMRDDLLQ